MYQFTFPPTGQEVSVFSTPSPAFIVCRFCDDGHSHRCEGEVVPHCMEGCGGSVVKNPSTNTGEADLIPGPGRAPGEAKGNPFKYSCLEDHMNRGAWRARVHGVAKSQT